MIDSHCHLDDHYFRDDREAVMARARAAGVTAFISIGVGGGLTAPRQAVALAQAASDAGSDLYATVGVHPHDVAAMTEDDWTELGALARRTRVVGVGETGLDYHYNHSPREAQIAAYHRFAGMAQAAGLPLVSHVRDAHADAAEVLRSSGMGDRGVIHCFTGGVAEARVYLDLGHHLSFSGILTFKTADAIREAAAFAPLDRILVETDAPYLAPIPYRGKRNEPAYIASTLAALASLRGMPVAELDAATTANTVRLFKLQTER
jgi:TatD DNase family protein